jgi:alpha-glucosidase
LQTAHLPQPGWFSEYAVSVQETDPESTLNLYRRALALRGQLFAGNDLSWVDSEPSVLHFERAAAGVRCMTNFGAKPVSLPAGEVLLSSAQLEGGRLPAEAAVWLRMAIDPVSLTTLDGPHRQ